MAGNDHLPGTYLGINREKGHRVAKLKVKLCPACRTGNPNEINAHNPESPGYLEWWQEENSRVVKLTDLGWVSVDPTEILEREIGVNSCTNGERGWLDHKAGIYLLPHVH